jgi:hypothetical protein
MVVEDVGEVMTAVCGRRVGVHPVLVSVTRTDDTPSSTAISERFRRCFLVPGMHSLLERLISPDEAFLYSIQANESLVDELKRSDVRMEACRRGSLTVNPQLCNGSRPLATDSIRVCEPYQV